MSAFQEYKYVIFQEYEHVIFLPFGTFIRLPELSIEIDDAHTLQKSTDGDLLLHRMFAN